MKIVHAALIFITIICLNIDAAAYTRIYLLSDIDLEKANLLVSDICKMEGDNISLISDMVISPELYSDGLIENKELLDLLSPKLNGKLFIFGSGVQVRKKIINPESVKTVNILIKKGQTIGLLIRKNGITIEMKGKALSNGSENDEIDIKLPTGAVLKGRITSDKKADISL